MKFDDAAAVDQIAYEMRLADYPRSLDRARINELMNGVPPYSQEEVEANGIEINVNFLEGTRLGHDARAQFNGNFLKPGRYFNAKTDYGPPHKRTLWSHYVTKEISKRMKASSVYYETFRSKFALDVLHGIGPSGWDTPDHWCPDAYGVEDVLVPANTMLTMKNLPFFILYHSYTAPELIRLTRDREVARKAGWNLTLVDQCIQYLDQETMALSHNQWPEVWSPEKQSERVKGDGGFYAADSVPTIDCFDFYFWSDEGGKDGWCRRIVLDAWSTPAGYGSIRQFSKVRNSKVEFSRNKFLFTSGSRKVANKWSELVAFQFADLSSVAPFRYHSVRSLGYLIYAIGNLQNRLRCRFNEAVWESTLMYLRVRSLDDVERALKVELANRGFVDESVQFIPAAERFQVNHQLVELGLRENEKIIVENTSSYVQDANRMGQDRTERTKFEVMARIQQMTALISAGLQQAYRYQEYEYREIFRRFLLPNSRDPDVNSFRASCRKYGIPEKVLVPEAWDIDPERVLGAGNKTLEMAMAEQLMQYRVLYDPDAQREILRDVTLAITDDCARAETLVPETPNKVTDSVHDAELATAALMMGLPVSLKRGMNHIEYVDTMMLSMAKEIAKVQQRGGGVATQQQIEGFSNLAQHIGQHVAIVSQDDNEKERVKKWGDAMGKMMNMVKAYAQRLQEQQQQAGPQIDAETQAKIQSMKVLSEAKAANTRESHAQRTAQRQLQFEQEMKQNMSESENEMKKQNAELLKQVEEMKLELAKVRQEYQLEAQATEQDHALSLRARRTEHDMDLEKKKAEKDIEIEAEKKKAKIRPKTKSD